MQPYGNRGYWEQEDFSPPTRITGPGVHHRKETRRLFHKQARNDAKRDIKEQFKDVDSM